MIKISPFTPLFFSPSSDKFGADSKYVQLFSPSDNIFIQVITTTEYKMEGYLIDKVHGSKKTIEFQSFSLKDNTIIFHCTLTGLLTGYYSVLIGDQECDTFKITDDEQELRRTTLIRYSMRNNKQRNDCVFWNNDTQFYFEFRAPGGFKDDDWTFGVNNEQFEISNGDIVELFAIESTQKKFTLGNSEGCPVWFAEHLNRILCCSNVSFNGTRFVRKGSSVPEMTQEVVSLKSYIFKVSLQGMIDNIDIDLPEGGETEGGGTGSGGEGYIYLIKLNDTVVPTDRNTYSSLRILAEIDKAINSNNEVLGKKFISKEKDDKAAGIIQFLQGITVGESIIDSLLAGSGIIAKDGRIQADRMELRSSLTVFETIFNRLSAMEGDYSFSESGTIETVEQIDATTYRLTLRKRWENDFTAFEEHDIAHGTVNKLASGAGSYYNSWFRVISMNAPANTIMIVLYPDAEVPGGKNYPPEPLMVITHRGNPVNTNRQGYWYISSYEHCICMLDGVTAPVLQESNYAVIIGRLKNLSIFNNLPVNYLHSYIYCRGIAIQDLLRIDYKGNPVKSENCRGKWSAALAVSEPYKSTDIMYDSVYHVGCKWMCLTSGTVQEPRWNATGWVTIEGNSDLTLEFSSSNGFNFFAGKVNTVITPTVLWGYNDISVDVLAADWAWTRDSGLVTEDNAWAISHANNGRILNLSNEDMPASWQKIKFTCTAYVRDGAAVNNISNYVSL